MSKKDALKNRVRVEFMESAPESKKGIIKKAYSGKARAMAVKAKCLDCCGFVQEEISNCETFTCPLWDYRPYQKS
jgi:hypothetical protein